MCLNLKEYYTTIINTHHTLHRHQPRQACSSHHQIVIWICFWQTQPIYKYWDGNAVYTNLVGGRELKLRLILVIQCSRGSSRFLRRPWSTDRTLGLGTLEFFLDTNTFLEWQGPGIGRGEQRWGRNETCEPAGGQRDESSSKLKQWSGWCSDLPGTPAKHKDIDIVVNLEVPVLRSVFISEC